MRTRNKPARKNREKPVAEIKAPEHSVIVYFKYGKEEIEPLHELVLRLEKMLSGTNAGVIDGHEIAMDHSEGSLYLYGPNAETLFKAVKPALEEVDFLQGAVAVLRFGGINEKAPDIEVEIGAE
jgi:hypothetical protein